MTRLVLLAALTIAAIGAATIAALTALQPAQWIDWDEQATDYDLEGPL